MPIPYKRIELFANLAIIVVAFFIVAVGIQRFVLSRKNAPPSPVIAIGSKVALADVDWAKNRKTLLLALQTGCHFCSESAPFYQHLIQAAASKDVKLVAVLPQSPVEAHEYVNSLGISITDIKQSSLSSLNVSGTPTLILVDGNGQVAASWVGKLPPSKESEVIAAF